MKKILASLLLAIGFISSASAADDCRQYAYGYMVDGKVYMMLAGKKYGPYESVESFKMSLERMWPQFKDNLKRYMAYNATGGVEKYLVYREELGDCNPYSLDMDTVGDWNAKVTKLFQSLNLRFANNAYGYKTALSGAIAKIEAKIAEKKGNEKTLEILRLIRDRFIAKLKTL